MVTGVPGGPAAGDTAWISGKGPKAFCQKMTVRSAGVVSSGFSPTAAGWSSRIELSVSWTGTSQPPQLPVPVVRECRNRIRNA
jgi:hypothetical protein